MSRRPCARRVFNRLDIILDPMVTLITDLQECHWQLPRGWLKELLARKDVRDYLEFFYELRNPECYTISPSAMKRIKSAAKAISYSVREGNGGITRFIPIMKEK